MTSVALLFALMVAGCSGSAPAALPAETDSARPAPIVDASPSPDVRVIAEPDAPEELIVVTGRVTAQNGAALDVTLTLDSLPSADAALLADMLAQCFIRPETWPADAASALLWSQTLTAVPVEGTTTWPGGQELWLLSLAPHGLSAGDGAVQRRTESGRWAFCEAADTSITPLGPGTTRLTLLTPPSRAFTGFSPDEILAIGQYGFATNIDAATASTITDCRVVIAPEVEAARARVGQPWRFFAEYEPWAADGDFCGVGVPYDEIP